MPYHFEKLLKQTFWRKNKQLIQVKTCFKKFKSGDTNLADEEGSRSSNFDDHAPLATVEKDENVITRILTEETSI